jgi:exodeoxyribonuclease-5
MKMIKRLELELTEAYREEKLHFQLNPDAAIGMARLIVCDEASMVGDMTTEDLSTFGVPILAMGDPGQLQPIEQKPGLTAGKPDFQLTEVHRQAHDNPILHVATLAREGKDIPFGKYGDTVEVIRRREENLIYDRDTLPKFIAGTNKTRWKINQVLREEFGLVERAGDRVGPQAGEPLIVCKNHREYPDLPNGSECVATSSADLYKGDTSIRLSFEDEEGHTYADRKVFQGLFEEHFSRKPGGYTATDREAFRARKATLNMDWGYCITCHKSQGSEYSDVVVIDESSVFREDADRWLYTATTRASQTLKILV